VTEGLARRGGPGPGQPGGPTWDDQVAEDLVATVRAACAELTVPGWQALRDCVQQACALPSRPGWEHKAAAHAEMFRLLAEAAAGRAPGSSPGGGARLVRELLVAVGPASNGMVASSHRRLLSRLRAGDADRAAYELAGHLAGLRYMWRLAAARSRSSDLTSG
jgi:DNA-binding FadR family transcriptional regulator